MAEIGGGWPRDSALGARTARAPSPPAPALGAPPGSVARQGCARRRGPGSPPRGRRSGGVRHILAVQRGARGFSLSVGHLSGLETGAASQLPRAATVTSRPQPGPLGARAGGLAGAPPPRLPWPGARPRRACPRPVPPPLVPPLLARPPARCRRGTGTSLAKRDGTGESAVAAPGRPDRAGRDGRGLLRMEGASPPSCYPTRAGSLWE